MDLSLPFSLFIPRWWIRGRKRARRERETCSHTLYLQIHVAGKHTHPGGGREGEGGRHVAVVAGRRENSTGRFICMLVFFRSLERSLLSDSRPTTRYYDNRGGIFFVHPRPPPLQTATASRPSVEREKEKEEERLLVRHLFSFKFVKFLFFLSFPFFK